MAAAQVRSAVFLTISETFAAELLCALTVKGCVPEDAVAASGKLPQPKNGPAEEGSTGAGPKQVSPNQEQRETQQTAGHTQQHR